MLYRLKFYFSFVIQLKIQRFNMAKKIDEDEELDADLDEDDDSEEGAKEDDDSTGW